MCFGWKKLVLLLFFFFFFKERINGNRRESIVGRGVADAFTCDCWQNHFDGNTCAWHMLYPFFTSFFFFFPFCFVAIAIEIFFWRPTYGIPAVKIQQTKLTFRPIIVFLITFVQIRIWNRLIIIQFLFFYPKFLRKTYFIISKERFFSKI